jgi:hypothetical protein
MPIVPVAPNKSTRWPDFGPLSASGRDVELSEPGTALENMSVVTPGIPKFQEFNGTWI